MFRKLGLSAIALAVTASVAACGTSDTDLEIKPAGDTSVTSMPTDLWSLVDQSVAQVPLTPDKIEAMLNTTMSPVTPYRWDGGPVDASPELKIISTYSGVGDDGWAFSGFDIEITSCVRVDDLKARYSDLERTGVPMGHSPQEEFVWTSTSDWGTLNFGIKEKAECVTSITLRAAGI